VRLVLAGAGDDPGLVAAVRAVGPPHAAVALPFLPDVRPLYQLLELVLLPSRHEGLSQSLLEGMALGKPAIASAAAGNLDLITPEVDGLLVAPDDAPAWAAALERLLADGDLARQLGEAARRTARETFALEHTVSRTLALYQEVTAFRLARPPRSG
jgi:glycosyltransferase involved in cell wall biosynthesis